MVRKAFDTINYGIIIILYGILLSHKVTCNVVRSILEKAGWPVSQKTVKLVSEEIELGELYLTQSAQLREHMTKSGEK